MIHFGRRPLAQLDNFGPSIQIPDFLSKNECKLVTQFMPEKKLTEALISEIGVKNTSIRSTKVCALDYSDPTKWIFDKIEDAVTQLNDEIYKMDIRGIHEAVQLMQYTEGSFYNWHADSGALQFSRRKLSVSVQLSEPTDYDGGDLEFFQNGIAPKDQGTLILFPSYFYHRVTRLTRGVRKTLIVWIDGPPYK